ncbi:MAG: TVP38/TMEM64 family protein [Acetobacteraceae bacterium]
MPELRYMESVRTRAIIGALIIVLLATVASLFVLHVIRLPSFDDLRAHERALAAYRAQYPLRLAAIYGVVVVVVAALPLPGAEALAIAAGALFGLTEGIIMIALAVTIGACAAFLAGRWWLGDLAKRYLTGRFAGIADELEREGAYYLFALRMIPAVPFFLVNLLIGATSLRLVTFYSITQVAVLPTVIAYVNAGRALGRIESLAGIVSPSVLLSFAVIGILPLAGRHGIAAWRRWRERRK